MLGRGGGVGDGVAGVLRALARLLEAILDGVGDGVAGVLRALARLLEAILDGVFGVDDDLLDAVPVRLVPALVLVRLVLVLVLVRLVLVLVLVRLVFVLVLVLVLVLVRFARLVAHRVCCLGGVDGLARVVVHAVRGLALVLHERLLELLEQFFRERFVRAALGLRVKHERLRRGLSLRLEHRGLHRVLDGPLVLRRDGHADVLEVRRNLRSLLPRGVVRGEHLDLAEHDEVRLVARRRANPRRDDAVAFIHLERLRRAALRAVERSDDAALEPLAVRGQRLDDGGGPGGLPEPSRGGVSVNLPRRLLPERRRDVAGRGFDAHAADGELALEVNLHVHVHAALRAGALDDERARAVLLPARPVRLPVDDGPRLRGIDFFVQREVLARRGRREVADATRVPCARRHELARLVAQRRVHLRARHGVVRRVPDDARGAHPGRAPQHPALGARAELEQQAVAVERAVVKRVAPLRGVARVRALLQRLHAHREVVLGETPGGPARRLDVPGRGHERALAAGAAQATRVVVRREGAVGGGDVEGVERLAPGGALTRVAALVQRRAVEAADVRLAPARAAAESRGERRGRGRRGGSPPPPLPDASRRRRLGIGPVEVPAVDGLVHVAQTRVIRDERLGGARHARAQGRQDGRRGLTALEVRERAGLVRVHAPAAVARRVQLAPLHAAAARPGAREPESRRRVGTRRERTERRGVRREPRGGARVKARRGDARDRRRRERGASQSDRRGRREPPPRRGERKRTRALLDGAVRRRALEQTRAVRGGRVAEPRDDEGRLVAARARRGAGGDERDERDERRRARAEQSRIARRSRGGAQGSSVSSLGATTVVGLRREERPSRRVGRFPRALGASLELRRVDADAPERGHPRGLAARPRVGVDVKRERRLVASVEPIGDLRLLAQPVPVEELPPGGLFELQDAQGGAGAPTAREAALVPRREFIRAGGQARDPHDVGAPRERVAPR